MVVLIIHLSYIMAHRILSCAIILNKLSTKKQQILVKTYCLTLLKYRRTQYSKIISWNMREDVIRK